MDLCFGNIGGGEFVISYSWELLNPDAIKVRQIGDLFFEYVFLGQAEMAVHGFSGKC